MNYHYHINAVTTNKSNYAKTANDLKLVEQAVSLYPRTVSAMQTVVQDGDWQRYCDEIEEYDRFMWIESNRGDKVNLFSYKKIKISTSWTEQLWAPVFERVRLHLNDMWGQELTLIQNVSVTESWTDRPVSNKDVDGGIGIRHPVLNCVMPVIVVEDKTGHYCKTACNNVDGILSRFRKMNPRVLGFCVTDNKINVGKTSLVESVWSSGGVLISQRGRNGVFEQYPRLNADKFEMVEKLCKNYLAQYTASDFINVQSVTSSGRYLRQDIDSKGCYVPPELECYLT